MAQDADWISITYDLTVNTAQERGGDEPRVQFLFITTEGDRAVVDSVDTGRIASRVRSGTTTRRGHVSSSRVPSRSDPFLGLIVRATEDDRSRPSERRRSLDRLESDVLEKAQQLLDRGRLNSSSELWVSANNAPLVGRFARRKDDKIGVSIRRYPEFGNELSDAARDDTGPFRASAHTIRGFEKEFLVRFIENGANYALRGRVTGSFLT